MKQMFQRYFIYMILLAMPAIFLSCKPSKKTNMTKTRQIPLRDFFRNPDKTAYQISPDGEYFSFMAPVKKRMNVFIQKSGSDKAIQITHETERDVSGYFWANNKRILFLKDSGGDENYKLFAVNINGTELKALTDFPKVKTQVIDDLEDIDDEIIVGLNKRDAKVFDAYRLNIINGELKMIAENPGNITSWMTDHEGKLRLASATDGVNQSLLYRKTESDAFKTILTTNFKESLDPQFFTFDNKRLYALSNLGRDKTVAVEFDPETAKEVKVIYENSDYDISGISYSRKRKVLTAAFYIDWKTNRFYFDKEAEELYNNLKMLLGDMEIRIADRTKDESKYIVRTFSDRSLGSYYFYDKTTKKLQFIHEVAPWLKEEDLAEMKPVQYKSRDGLTIHGYLTLPKGLLPKEIPVVINPHGGPWVRDTWGYNSEVQFLANRGYAVFQMNYRGSTGYGKAFWEKSFKQWGKTMQDDITDGVRWLIHEGIADPKRVAIYGGSYGGYATLAGVTYTPDLYAAGIDYVGVSNLFTFMKTIPPYWLPMLEMMHEMVGNPNDEKDSLHMREASPVFHSDRIKCPMFIAQGANDPRVNKNESDQIVEALKKRGVYVEYMVKDNEGHGFRNEENRFDFYEAMEKFLLKHIGMKKYKIVDDGVI
jgi:dipeptidyl aminopeptidase/acylaminoacyl peptidase